jgi:hypothetical protein
MPTQFNYGYCDKPDCEYCTQVKAANAGAVEPPLAASQTELASAKADVEHSIEVAVLQEAAARADSVFNVAQGLGKRVDAAVSGLVHGVSVLGIVKSPKAADPDGTVYIVDPDPTKSNVFNGHANEVASKTGGTWTFQAAHDKETHLVESDNMMWTWSTATTPPQWVKVGSTGNAEKVDEAIHKAMDKPIPNDNDELALTDSEDTASPFSLKKLTWANLKKALWGSIPALPHDSAPANLPDASIFPVWDTDGNAIYSTTFAVIRDKVLGGLEKWLYAAAVNSPIDKNDRFVVTGQVAGIHGVFYNTYAEVRDWIFGQATSELADGTPMDSDVFPFSDGVTKTPHKVSLLKLKTAMSNAGPIYLWKNSEDGSTANSGTFVIPTGTNTRLIEIDGWIAPAGTDSAYPVLVLGQGSADVATTSNFGVYGLLTYYASNQVINRSSYNGTGIRLCDTSSVTTHMKGNDNAYLSVKVYRNDNYVEITWNIVYRSQNSTMIRVDGYCSGTVPVGEITAVGISYLDSTSGNARSILADAKCVLHH